MLDMDSINSHAHLIIVMGVSGSGKSTLAQRLGETYNIRYLDADDFHSDDAKARMQQGLPLTDDMRLPWVDRIAATLTNLYANNQSCVLAFSGLRRAHRERLRNNSPFTPSFILLQAPQSVIESRVALRQNHFMNPGLVSSQYATMEAPSNEPDIFVINADQPAEKILEQATQYLHRHFLVDHSQ